MNFKRIFSLALLSCAGLGFSQSYLMRGGLMLVQTQVVQKVALTKVGVLSALSRAQKLSATDPNQVMFVTVSLPFGDPAGMQAYADSVSNPSSPNYRNYLTPDEVGTRFGLTTDQVTAISTWLKSQGFSVTLIAKNHLTVTARCTVQQAEAAFGTQINDYQLATPQANENKKFFAYNASPQVPASLASSILSISGLQNYTKPTPLITTLTPAQTRTLYQLAPLYNAGFRGQGRTVAISNWDGFRLTNVPLFYTKFGLPSPAAGIGTNIRVIPVDGANGQTVAAGGEADLDIQMVLGEAPLCNLLVYDNAPNGDQIGVITQEANDNLADIISESWEWTLPDSDATAAHNIHLSMTAQGITYMEASGDSGAQIGRGLAEYYPHEDPEVLSVGGTVATTDGPGNRITEVAWTDGGGGWANDNRPFNVRPSWQNGNGVPTSINRRLLPDVSLQAGNIGAQGAYFFFYQGAQHGDFSGTSFAGPVFAGELAVAEQRAIAQGGLAPNGAGKRRLGRMQDLIYRQNGRSDMWYDVVSGTLSHQMPNGQSAQAHTGWDFASCWGAVKWNTFSIQSSITLPIGGTFLSVVEGTGLNGSTNALIRDNFYYRIQAATVPNLGQVGSASYQFTLPITVSRASVQNIDFTTITKFAPGATGQIYLFNYMTGRWDLLKSFPLSSTGLTTVASLKTGFTTYMSAAGQYRILVRGLLPTSSGVTGNSFDTDYVTSTVQYMPTS